MAVLDFPDIAPDDESWTLRFNTQTFESGLNGAMQTRKQPGARWQAELTFSSRQGRDVRELKGFLTRLEGRAGRVYIVPSDAEPLGTAEGSPELSADASAGNTTIQTTNWTASQPEALAIGDFFELNGELKQVTQTVAADGSGNATVNFSPALRADVGTGVQLRLADPRCQMMLENDEQASWQMQAPIIYALTLRFREPLDI